MKNAIWVSFMLLAATSACKKDEAVRQPDTSYNPAILAANFTNSANLTNPLFPYQPGKRYILEGQTSAGLERIEIERLATNKTVMGITCAVIRDRVWVNGLLVEDTDDWYAQDNAGTVWYMGEYVTDLNPDGSVKDHDGSWEAGVDGAKPGINMPADPKVGMAYRQEYYFDEAEDKAEVVGTGLTVTVLTGTYTGCVQTYETSDLDPELKEHKFYAPNIGFIKGMNLVTGETVELIDIQ